MIQRIFFTTDNDRLRSKESPSNFVSLFKNCCRNPPNDCRTAAPQKTSTTALLTDVEQRIILVTGTSIERPNVDTVRRYERLPKRLGGLSVALKDLPRSARIHRALSRDPKIRLRSLVAPTGEHTQSEGKPWISCFLLTSPIQLVWREERYPQPSAVPTGRTGGWLRRF